MEGYAGFATIRGGFSRLPENEDARARDFVAGLGV